MIKENVVKILKELPDGVGLVGAAKTKSPEEVLEAIEGGLQIVGENYVQEAREKIDKVLDTLTARQRMIFILRHYQHLSTSEIAEYMSCSQGSVKKQLFRAVQAMKQHLKGFILEKNYEMQKI